MRMPVPAPDAETIAIAALNWIAGEPERLSRFLSITGLGPANLRHAAGQPGFLAAVLDHVGSDDALLQSFAADAGFPPADVALARERLSGPRFD